MSAFDRNAFDPRGLLYPLDPLVAVQAISMGEANLVRHGILLRVTQGLRSVTEQMQLWQKGRTAPGEPCWHKGERAHRDVGTCAEHPLGVTVTNARPGYSFHNFGRAFDVCIVTFDGDTTPKDVFDGPWETVGVTGEEFGLEWGGNWKFPDRPHFENRAGLSLAQWRARVGIT